MAQSSTLNLLLEQAERERDLALAAANAAEQRFSRARLQSADLQGYQGDYQQRWQQQFRQGSGIETLRCYQSFAGRLEEAIGQQQRLTEHLQQQWQAAQQQLQQRELRLASIRKLIERRQAEIQRGEARAEQKRTDEWASRIRETTKELR